MSKPIRVIKEERLDGTRWSVHPKDREEYTKCHTRIWGQAPDAFHVHFPHVSSTPIQVERALVTSGLGFPHPGYWTDYWTNFLVTVSGTTLLMKLRDAVFLARIRWTRRLFRWASRSPVLNHCLRIVASKIAAGRGCSRPSLRDKMNRTERLRALGILTPEGPGDAELAAAVARVVERGKAASVVERSRHLS